ncbi:ribonuclease P protein subunit p21-like [Halichondria panicea]|uniref:ribonuclease P protein subunit p21-like n=1 Tax=Halichondria panicea TaxID=6063 RepID=UPI00312B6B14
MGRKKNKGSSTGYTSVPHKEAFQRMNYLFQAALAALCSTPSETGLSRFYVRTMKRISKRLVLRMDPSIKRVLCKSCDSLLVAGVTCTNRLKSARDKHIVVKCLTCGTLKRFLTDNDYVLWSEIPENVAVLGKAPIVPVTDKPESQQVSQQQTTS